MTDENVDTVDSFPSFSILKEDNVSKDGYEIYDDGADSSRVFEKVTSEAEKLSDSTKTARVLIPSITLQAIRRLIPFNLEQTRL